jgi:hypothetical protein
MTYVTVVKSLKINILHQNTTDSCFRTLQVMKLFWIKVLCFAAETSDIVL